MATKDGDIYVLYVHGMGATPLNYYVPLLDQGEQLLNGSFSPSIKSPAPTCGGDASCRAIRLPDPVIVRGEGMSCDQQPEKCYFDSFGELRRFSLELADQSIHVYSFYWDDAADQLQRSYSYTDQSVKPRPSLINRLLKERIVNEGFSDAVLYAGRFGGVMRQGLEAAICLMLIDSQDLPSPDICRLGDLAEYKVELSSLNIAVVTKSLGSRYVFDTLLPIDQLDELTSLSRKEGGGSIVLPAEAEDALAAITVKRSIVHALTDVYMLANQLPLLGLAALQASDEATQQMRDQIYCEHVLQNPGRDCRAPWLAMSVSGEPRRSAETQSFFDFVASVRPDAPLTLVAFHDPEDVLGYKAGVHLSPRAAATVKTIEVEHRNAHVLLFGFAWPPSAHATEDERRSSAKIIWCGGTVEDDGRIRAGECAI